MIRPLILFGTRPEAIKLAPVVRVCQSHAGVEPLVCSTGQHRELLEQAVRDMDLSPRWNLDLMRPGQSPMEFLSRGLDALSSVLSDSTPTCVVVQGDTTTALAGSLQAFHMRIPIVHVEAGLRTGDLQNPFPEELNRRAITLMASLHCAPTERAANMLRQEGVQAESIRMTGNTIVDAVQSLLATSVDSMTEADQGSTTGGVLITTHRRENFGDGLQAICRAVRQLLHQYPSLTFHWPLHPNPNVLGPVREFFCRTPGNLQIIAPLSYPQFLRCMSRSRLLLTDSGGAQEEAATLGIPTVILRSVTERQEAVETGLAALAGLDTAAIVSHATRFLNQSSDRHRSDITASPFGDGRASVRIVDWICERWG